jgi:sugar phosphate isomerase/epimerase
MIPRDLIGIGSYAFRYAARKKEAPMDAVSFVEETSCLGLARALICENLNYSELDDCYYKKLSETAGKYGITVEVGMRGVSTENIQRHIYIAGILKAKLIRMVLGGTSEILPSDLKELKSEALKSIYSVVPLLEEADISLGIENHFDLATIELIDIVSQINSKRVGLIFDSTNCLGLIEKPLDVLCMMKEHLLSVHLKDYEARKTDGGYFFSGVDLGEGSLDIEAVIQKAHSFNPHASFIVEYNMKPPGTMTENELLCWERDCAQRNVSAILDGV